METDAPARSSTRAPTVGAVIELDAIRDRLDELLELYRAHDNASFVLNEALKVSATISGLEVAVLRRFVAARFKNSGCKRRQEAAQLCLLFEEFGDE